jgi:hypothetical protein
MTGVGVALIAVGLIYVLKPDIFRRSFWTRTDILQQVMRPHHYLIFMRGLGIALIASGGILCVLDPGSDVARRKQPERQSEQPRELEQLDQFVGKWADDSGSKLTIGQGGATSGVLVDGASGERLTLGLFLPAHLIRGAKGSGCHLDVSLVDAHSPQGSKEEIRLAFQVTNEGETLEVKDPDGRRSYRLRREE